MFGGHSKDGYREVTMERKKQFNMIQDRIEWKEFKGNFLLQGSCHRTEVAGGAKHVQERGFLSCLFVEVQPAYQHASMAVSVGSAFFSP